MAKKYGRLRVISGVIAFSVSTHAYCAENRLFVKRTLLKASPAVSQITENPATEDFSVAAAQSDVVSNDSDQITLDLGAVVRRVVAELFTAYSQEPVLMDNPFIGPDEEEEGASTSAPHCPRCAAPLVAREAKKGPHAGRLFLACSRFPECRYAAPQEQARH